MPASSEKLKKRDAMRQLVTTAVERGLDTDVPVLAFEARLVDGVDVDSDDALLTPAVIIAPRPHPLLEALMETRGARRTGQLTWTIDFGENYTDAAFRVLTNNVKDGSVWPEALMSTTKGPRNLAEYNATYNKSSGIRTASHGTMAEHFWSNNADRLNCAHPADNESYGAIGVSFGARAAYVKVFTHNVAVPGLPEVKLDLRPADDKPAREPKPLLATHAIEALEWLQSQGIVVMDPDPSGPIAKLRKRIASTVIAYPTPGAPALAEVSVGRQVRSLVDLGTDAPAEQQAATRGRVPAEQVEAALRAAPLVSGAIHPGTRDVGNLTLSEPFLDERLRSYQQVAVGMHLTTEIGYLNASSPGMGKTVMCLSGMRERAKRTPGYRGLIVVEANVRHQWGPEAAIWFPDATVVTVNGSKDVEKVAVALAEAGTKPLVVISSYAMLKSVTNEMEARELRAEATRDLRVLAPIDGRTIGAYANEAAPEAPAADTEPTDGAKVTSTKQVIDDEDDQFALFSVEVEAITTETDGDVETRATARVVEAAEAEVLTPVTLGTLLLGTYWHDVIADEAEVLRNTGSKQGAALWEVRRNSGVAVALTGTPINRSIDDLGRLIAWCRNDAELFYGVKLSDQFPDLSIDSELERLRVAMGGAMFRADTSEVADEVPEVTAEIMKLRPSAAEKALADAARMELKRVYDELVEAIEMAEELDPDNADYAEARAALRQARGAHLGGTTLARMASSDPASLVGSTSAGAALLAGQGLVAAATAVAGTKRTAVVADTIRRVTEGECVLIFTEFATVATGLIADLDAAGIKVGAVLGGGGAKRDRMIEEFKDGKLDVLVCTSSGERGLNLQRASTIVHYDLPWAPKGVLQRTGRALRLESKNQKITLVFPLMEGTIEERVAATVVRRALEAMYALDKSRGVDISKTEIGLALGGLATTVADTAEGRSSGNELMDITRQLVGA